MNILPSAYCKRLSGEYPFYAEELVKIADFFGVSCDEVITGKPPEITAVYDNTPVDKSSISFINKLNYESPDCIELLNIILNNNDKNHLRERLLKTILYYCYGDIFKISSVSDSTPSGRAMLSMCTVFAQMERETIAERIKDNMHELAKSGRWLGGTTPTGYKSTQIVGGVTVDGKERKAYKLDIVKVEAELVQDIFEKFLETNSLTKTETYLLQNHIKTKNGKDFTRFSIRSILANPVYMIADMQAWNYFESMGVEIYADKSDFDGKHGVIAYSKTIQKPGKANQIKDMNEWIIAVGKHEGLISGRDWVKAQASLKQNRPNPITSREAM